MSIHCDICGTIIFNSIENMGSYVISGDFISRNPWANSLNISKINNSCLDCGKYINNEVSKATNGLIEKCVKEIRSKLDETKEVETIINFDKIDENKIDIMVGTDDLGKMIGMMSKEDFEKIFNSSFLKLFYEKLKNSDKYDKFC